MSFIAIIYRVMIASPTDVVVERSIIREILSEWNIVNAAMRKMVLLPIAWETHSSPEMGDAPQKIINKQMLKGSDLLVGVFWTRVGTATNEYASGTIEEIEEHTRQGKPVMLYFSDAPVRPDSVEETQYAELIKFKESCKSRGLYEVFTNISEFREKFYRQLQHTLNNNEYFTKQKIAMEPLATSTSTVPDIPEITREAQVLLKEAAKDQNGQIIRILFTDGISIQTNNRNFVEDNSPRSKAIWEGAIKELESHGFIQADGYKNEVFSVTRKGYEISEFFNP